MNVTHDFRSTDSRVVLSTAIERIPEPERQVMRMHLIDRKTADRIAIDLAMSVAEVEGLLDSGTTYLRRVLRLMDARLVAEIAKLPDEQRLALSMQVEHEMTHTEIAAVLSRTGRVPDCTPQHAARLVAQAMLALGP